ncbi:MAG: flagellar basal body P-ring formation chaperone FlgA [Pirellulaceae bacterium]
MTFKHRVPRRIDRHRPILSMVGWCCVVFTLLGLYSSGIAQTREAVVFDSAGNEIRLGSAKSRIAPISHLAPAQTQSWTLQLKSNVTVSASIVRVSDVVLPISIPDEQWSQLGKATIGLVPTDGRPLRLMRYRLAEALSQSKLVSAPILWVGPESTTVKSSPVVQASATQPIAQVRLLKEDLQPQSKRLIESAVKQAMREAKDLYTFEIDWSRVSVDALRDVTTFQKIAVPETITEGTARFILTAYVSGSPRDIPIYLEISALPRAIVAARNLSRGQILSADDLDWKSIGERDRAEQAISDLNSLIGQEVKRNIQAGRWISTSDVGPPILVRRNDVIEVMVVGGSVIVRTGGKALDDGAEGDLIQIETVEDRKRLLARVVGSGLVEIVTRAPQVR